MIEIPVVCAVIRNSRRQILLAQRAEPAALRGLWEFPGGKIEDGESAEEALLREIKEELNLAIELRASLGIFPYQLPYPGKPMRLLLHAFAANALSDSAQVIEHLDVRWVEVQDLGSFQFAPADLPIIPVYLDLHGRE